jgi:hypothetical protein
MSDTTTETRMAPWMRAAAIAVAASMLAVANGFATPSTTFWAPSTPTLQSYGVLHLTYDSYFNSRAAYPVTLGLEMGVLPGKKLQAEAGFDVLYPTFATGEPLSVPILLNAKFGAPEDAYFKGSPGWSAGIFALGLKKDATDYDVLHAMIGRTFPQVGALAVGGYYALNEKLFHSSDGDVHRSGFMAGWTSPSIGVPVIDHLQLAADVQTGRNVFGAAGGGAYFYLTPAVDLLIGPVVFFDRDLQPGRARSMWSVQFDADLSFVHH